MDNFLNDPSRGKVFNSENINYPMKTECIIVDKVYAHCQIRECFSDVRVNVGEKKVKSIKYKEGFVVPGSLSVSEIPNRRHFKRLKFTLRVPYKVVTKCDEVISGVLPDIKKDIVVFMPESRDEFEFKIVVETSSKTLGKEVSCDGVLTFATGVFAIIKVVGKVQLLIPAFGFCPEPPECEEYTKEDICSDFEDDCFPEFFPKQWEDIPCDELK